MKLVVVESPYGGNVAWVERNVRYARACLRDCLMRGEAPFASHLLYTQPGVLQDEVSEERELGILAGFCWRGQADLTAVYTDLGISKGMQQGIQDSEDRNIPCVYRQLGGEWSGDENSAGVARNHEST